MIHPSYKELIDAINDNNEDNDNTMSLNSRYSLVLATSRRAREIIGGSEPLVATKDPGKKPLSIAIDEFYEGKIKILSPDEDELIDVQIAPAKSSSISEGDILIDDEIAYDSDEDEEVDEEGDDEDLIEE